MKYHILFLPKLGKRSQNLSSAAVVIGALRVKYFALYFITFDVCACVRMLSCLFVFAHVYLCLIFSYLS